MGVQIPPWEGAILRGKDMPADLSPLAAANELVRRLRCGGIIARAERANSSSRGVRCGLSSNYFDHLLRTGRRRYQKNVQQVHETTSTFSCHVAVSTFNLMTTSRCFDRSPAPTPKHVVVGHTVARYLKRADVNMPVQ